MDFEDLLGKFHSLDMDDKRMFLEELAPDMEEEGIYIALGEQELDRLHRIYGGL